MGEVNIVAGKPRKPVPAERDGRVAEVFGPVSAGGTAKSNLHIVGSLRWFSNQSCRSLSVYRQARKWVLLHLLRIRVEVTKTTLQHKPCKSAPLLVTPCGLQEGDEVMRGSLLHCKECD